MGQQILDLIEESIDPIGVVSPNGNERDGNIGGKPNRVFDIEIL